MMATGLTEPPASDHNAWRGGRRQTVGVVAVVVGIAVVVGLLPYPGGALAAAVLLVAATAALYRPWLAYCVLLALLPLKLPALWVPVPGIEFNLMPYQVVTVLVFAAMLIRAPASWLRLLRTSSLTQPLLIFVGLALLSGIYAEDRRAWLHDALALCVSVGVYAVTRLLAQTPDRFLATCKLVAKLLVFYALWGLVDYGLFWLGLPSNTMGARIGGVIDPPRARGSMSDPNDFMAWMTAMLPMAVVWVASMSRQRWRLWMLAVPFYLVLLIVSGSRGGMVALAAVLLLGAVLSMGRHPYVRDHAFAATWRRLSVVTALWALVAALVVVAFVPLAVLRVARTFDESELEVGRLAIWKDTLEALPGHPMGVGMGNRQVSQVFTLQRVAHNVFLQILGELGPLGLLAYIWVLVTTIQVWLRTRGDPRYGRWMTGLALGVAAFHLSGMFLSNVYQEMPYLLWGLMMVGESLCSPPQMKKPEIDARVARG
ncbi:MAG: hypothetical protein GX100_01515 [candidate division WS1 bacterium]|nr:hypothetical protein [candidate division WS1 bacterium]